MMGALLSSLGRMGRIGRMGPILLFLGLMGEMGLIIMGHIGLGMGLIFIIESSNSE